MVFNKVTEARIPTRLNSTSNLSKLKKNFECQKKPIKGLAQIGDPSIDDWHELKKNF